MLAIKTKTGIVNFDAIETIEISDCTSEESGPYFYITAKSKPYGYHPVSRELTRSYYTLYESDSINKVNCVMNDIVNAIYNNVPVFDCSKFE